MDRFRNLCRFAAACVALTAVAAHGEQVTIERDTQLRAEPSLSAQGLATLKQGSRAELLDKRGVWVNVKSGNAAGWIFSFNVRYGERRAESAGDGFAAAGRMATRQQPSVVSTIGIRGLTEEDLQKASFNPAELRVLDGYMISKEAAEQQARTRGLSRTSVDYFEGRR